MMDKDVKVKVYVQYVGGKYSGPSPEVKYGLVFLSLGPHTPSPLKEILKSIFKLGL